MEKMDEETVKTYQLIALCEELVGVEQDGSSDLANFREDMRTHIQAMDDGQPVQADIETLIKRAREDLSSLDRAFGATAVKVNRFDIGF